MEVRKQHLDTTGERLSHFWDLMLTELIVYLENFVHLPKVPKNQEGKTKPLEKLHYLRLRAGS